MKHYTELKDREKIEMDNLIVFANMARDWIIEEMNIWLSQKEECDEQLDKLRDLVKNEILKILNR